MNRIKIRKRQKQEINEYIEEMFTIADETKVQEWDKETPENKMTIAINNKEGQEAIQKLHDTLIDIYKDNR